jgi:cellulose synthase/poly-beta-1,6-N-acetylglucosamine synthase-like glycosyltransferase
MQIQVTLLVIFAVTGCCYYMVITLILAGLARTKHLSVWGAGFSTRVSVIIPARNEKENIRKCLEDLLNQDFPGELMEAVIVDDGSVDETYAIAAEFSKEHPSFRMSVLKNESPENRSGSKKSAITQGVLHSTGELILATDADTVHGKKWVASMVGYFEKFHPEMILGPVGFVKGKSFFSKIQSLEFLGLMAVTEGSCSIGKPLMCNGANLAYTRKAFDFTGGFNDNRNIPSGDDMFLMMKIRKKFGPASVQFNRVEQAIVLTGPSRTLGEFIQQRLRWVSKNRSYTDPFILLVAVITWLFNASLFLGLVLGFFFPFFWIVTLLLLSGKILLEFPLLYSYSRFLRIPAILQWIPVAQVINIVYVSMIGILGNFLTYRWKGRKVSQTMRSSK